MMKLPSCLILVPRISLVDSESPRPSAIRVMRSSDSGSFLIILRFLFISELIRQHVFVNQVML
jgi:hypothetical protein